MANSGCPNDGADQSNLAQRILMAGQTPIVLFFAIKWLPQAPRESAIVIALQLIAALAAMAPVFLLHW